VEVEAGAALRQCGVFLVRGSHLPLGGLSLVFKGRDGGGTAAGGAIGTPGAVVESLDLQDVKLGDVVGVMARLDLLGESVGVWPGVPPVHSPSNRAPTPRPNTSGERTKPGTAVW